jgi:hypothetical protein
LATIPSSLTSATSGQRRSISALGQIIQSNQEGTMTKFLEMCEAYKSSRRKYFDYQQRCIGYLSKLGLGFVEYCSVPEDQYKFLPLNEDVKPNMKYTIFGATHLDKDTFWHLGLLLTLYEAPNVHPQQSILIRICVKELNGKVFVKIGSEGKTIEIELANGQQCAAFFDDIITQINDSFQNELQSFLERSSPLKRIGF